MESTTKFRQTPETLRAMIERGFGSSQVPDNQDFAEELGHGWFNVAYKIELADGTHTVLKIAPPPGVTVMRYEHEMMDNEIRSLHFIKDQTDVPVPTILFADQTHSLIDADYFFMDFIEGDNFGIVFADLTQQERDSYNEELGAYNRQINEVRGPHFGLLPGPGYATWREAFDAMCEDVLRDGEEAEMDLGWDYAQVRKVLADNAHTLDAVTEPRLVEWDLWNSNVMVKDGKIAAIIDHERTFYGDPLIEAGFCGNDLPEYFGDSSAFMRGYGWPELNENETTRRRLYTLYLVLIMIIETHYRGHEDLTQRNDARANLTKLMTAFGYSK